MPYDYYKYLKKQQENESYKKTSDLVRENMWSETINFKLSQKWMHIEDKILFRLYRQLRYS